METLKLSYVYADRDSYDEYWHKWSALATIFVDGSDESVHVYRLAKDFIAR